jgi:perosamine synthetase
MEALAEIARRHRLVIVEDCAEAIGTLYRGRHVGTFGQVGVFSFYGNKTITTGEGGMVVTNDAALLERAYRLKGQGLAPQREYWHNVVGYNYRMTNVCGAIGLAQLERVDSLVARKRDLAARYRHALSGLPLTMHGESEQGVHSYWMVSILVEHARHRDPLRDFLAAKGVETRPLFYPAHTMPMYASAQGHPVAEDLASRGINLPSWPALSDADVRYIAGCMKRYYETRA